MKVKILGHSVTLTTANNIASATAVLLVNAGSNAVVTQAGDVAGTFTLLANTSIIVHKKAADTLAQTGGTIEATPIAL